MRRALPPSSRPSAATPAAAGVPLLGMDLDAIDTAEDRTRFANFLERLGVPQPRGGMARSVDEALAIGEEIGYPVVVRPSFVIGGLAIDVAYGPSDIAAHVDAALQAGPYLPVRLDAYLQG